MKTFIEKYVSEAYVDRNKIEFLELRQNNSIVTNYEVQRRLGNYPNMF